MASVKTNIICAGQKLKVHHLKIEQPHNWHHSFEIAVSSETVAGKNAVNIDNAMQFLGELIDVRLEPKMKVSGNGLNFRGIVTSVNIDKSYTVDSLIVLTGYSPTYLLEDGKGCQSFEKLGGKEIFNKIVSAYPANLLNASASPTFNNKIPFCVKYKETNYQFLSRLAAMHGEWFYYNGLETIFGNMTDDDKVNVMLGKDLDSFGYGVSVKPSLQNYQSYSYIKNNQFEEVTQNSKPQWLDKYGTNALSIANLKFPGGHKFPIREDVKDEGLLKNYTDIKKSALLSDTTTFTGKSTNPTLTIGTKISVQANTIVSGSNVTSFVNEFRVIKATHYVDATKNYTNEFEAIPATVTTPPINPNVQNPEAESQVAVVKDNNDPDALGRIRVQFNWQNGNSMTPWIRQTTNYASGDRGTYFVPEIGDEVYIDFEQGNPDRPYMTGAKYHGKAKPEFFDPENNLKSIKTRSGHTVLFNDQTGGESITITDKNGNEILIDTVGNNMNITALENINFNARNVNFEVGQDVNWNIGNSESKTVGNNMMANAGNSIENIAANTVDMIGQNNLNLTSGLGNSLALSASGTAALKANSQLSVTSSGAITRNGSSGINDGSSVSIKINAPDVSINGGS